MNDIPAHLSVSPELLNIEHTDNTGLSKSDTELEYYELRDSLTLARAASWDASVAKHNKMRRASFLHATAARRAELFVRYFEEDLENLKAYAKLPDGSLDLTGISLGHIENLLSAISSVFGHFEGRQVIENYLAVLADVLRAHPNATPAVILTELNLASLSGKRVPRSMVESAGGSQLNAGNFRTLTGALRELRELRLRICDTSLALGEDK